MVAAEAGRAPLIAAATTPATTRNLRCGKSSWNIVVLLTFWRQLLLSQVLGQHTRNVVVGYREVDKSRARRSSQPPEFGLWLFL
eukprot:2648524-Rhodomonas_salina.1